MERGSQVHTGFEQLCTLRKEYGDWAKAYALMEEREIEGPVPQEELFNYLRRARPILEEFTPLEMEFWIEKLEYKGHSIPFCGKIDLLAHTRSKRECVLDFKTISSMSYAKSEFEARRSIQLQIYCFGTGARSAGFIYLPPRSPVELVSVDFTEAILDKGWQWLTHTVDTIEDRWARTPKGLPQDQPPKGWAMAEPTHHFCTEKCRFYNRCFKEVKDGQG
jgi:hypothetical protein